MPPRVSVVLLTWNEESNIAACLRSLARQGDGLEVIVVDAASTDRTVQTVLGLQPSLPFPLRLVVAERRIPIGEARNRGIQLARAPIVAFVSADAELADGWMAKACRTLERSDVAFGRQLHAPHAWTAAANVRGLRYHFPSGPATDAVRYASNVAAAYRRDVVEAFPFDDWADAAEDLLIARRAAAAGYQVAYNPLMVVRHHDVERAAQEWRKNSREGYGWGLYHRELGILWSVLAWTVLLAAAVAAFLRGPWIGAAALAIALWLPALRRAARGRHGLPAARAAVGILASPPFDLAFLANYLRGLAARRPVPHHDERDAPAKAESPA